MKQFENTKDRNRTIGYNVMRLRVLHGYRRQYVAEKIGMDCYDYFRLETEGVGVSLARIHAISDCLYEPLENFFKPVRFENMDKLAENGLSEFDRTALKFDLRNALRTYTDYSHDLFANYGMLDLKSIDTLWRRVGTVAALLDVESPMPYPSDALYTLRDFSRDYASGKFNEKIDSDLSPTDQFVQAYELGKKKNVEDRRAIAEKIDDLISEFECEFWYSLD